MSWDEIKDEKEGYVRVRKSEDRALIGRLRKANDDPDAKGYIELKVDDLGFEGGGGPHTHNNYALTGHTHDEYLTDLPDHSHPEYEGGTGGEGYDDTELLKRLEQDEAVIDDHDKRLDADERDISKNFASLNGPLYQSEILKGRRAVASLIPDTSSSCHVAGTYGFHPP